MRLYLGRQVFAERAGSKLRGVPSNLAAGKAAEVGFLRPSLDEDQAPINARARTERLPYLTNKRTAATVLVARKLRQSARRARLPDVRLSTVSLMLVLRKSDLRGVADRRVAASP